MQTAIHPLAPHEATARIASGAPALLTTRALQAKDRKAFVRVMGAALASDPLFLDFFGEDRRQPQAAHWRAVFFAYLFDRSLIAGHSLLGSFNASGSLLACCVLQDLSRSAGPAARLWWRALRLLPRLPWRTLRLLNRYRRFTRDAAPRSAHRCVTVIGTVPERQGQDIDIRLLQELIESVRLAGTVQSIALHTGNSGNVPRYEKLGFRPSQKLRVGQTDVHCMQLTL